MMKKGGELYFLDGNFGVIAGPVEGFSSIVWSERYFEPGTFTLHFPRSLVREIAGARYVRSAEEDGEILCGRIEYLNAGEGGDCELGGRLLECLLSDRVIGTAPPSGPTLTDTVCDTVEANLRGLGIAVDRNGSAPLPATSVTAGQWEDLGDWCYAVLKPFGAAPEVTLREQNGILVPVFRIAAGTDRSEAGTADRAVFSRSYENILSVSLERDSGRMKNAVYVEGADGTVVFADRSGGAQIRETYRKAADLRPASFADETEYRAALVSRGEELLARRGEILCVTAESDAEALPVYGRDYRLGDVCDVADEELGLSFAVRLTGVDTVWEAGGRLRVPFFGEEASLLRRMTQQ